MKVLLTGANGFVGSHILETLVHRGYPLAILLRRDARREWIRESLDQVDVRIGSLTDPAALGKALTDITHVVHCAGCTKALHPETYFTVNQLGTRHLIQAIERAAPHLERLMYVSSLAAAGPGTRAHPVGEEDVPSPVTVYGRSKLAGEREIRERCRVPFTILRPAAVFGPRDRDFLKLFLTVRGRVVPLVHGGRQELSLVYVGDLAESVVATLDHPGAVRATYHVAAVEPTTARRLTLEIARRMQVQVIPLPLPRWVLWLGCVGRDALSRATGRPHILSRQKYPELVAPGWVTRTDRLRQDVGFVCRTSLDMGLALTLNWYRNAGWL